MNKLSIGIPVYNQVATIGAAIESCLAQTSAPLEIVVCENYSTDGTLEIVESYRDRVRIVRPPRHYGMAANWNFCVRACRGEWVGLCSGDDLLLPIYVESLWAGTQRHPDAVFVMGGWQNFDEKTGFRRSHYLLSMRPVTHRPQTIEKVLLGPKASFAAFCFKRSAFEAAGGYDESFNLIQDWIMQFDIAKFGSFVKVDDLVARYRITARPSLDQKRWPLYVVDRIHFLSDKIGEAADHGVAAATIRRATKILLQDILREIRMQRVLLDTETEVILGKLAAQVGMSSHWEKWKAGSWTPPPRGRVREWLKSKLRRVITWGLRMRVAESISDAD